MPTPPADEPHGIDDPLYVKALAHPLRIRVLAMLGERDASPVQLAQHLDASLGTIAYHVRTLENLGLIKLVATHQRRGATEHVYRALPNLRITDRAWATAGPVAKQAMIGAALQQAGDYATRSAAAGGFDRPEAVATRLPLQLDATGLQELARRVRDLLEEAAAIAAAASERSAQTGEALSDVGLIALLFEAQPFLSPDSRALPGGPARAPGASA